MAKVYVFLADGVEEIEALTQVDILRRAGAEVVMVSVMEKKEIEGAHQIKMIADRLFDETLTDGDLLILPGGGVGTSNLKHHLGLKKLLCYYAQQHKMIAAICAAPGVLGIHHLLEGKRAVCYPGCEPDLIGAEIIDEKVVEDDNIITSKGPGTSIDFALALTGRLFGKEKEETIRKALQYEK